MTRWIFRAEAVAVIKVNNLVIFKALTKIIGTSEKSDVKVKGLVFFFLVSLLTVNLATILSEWIKWMQEN